MFAEIRAALRPTLVLLVVFTLLTGLAYPLLVTGLAQVLMPAAARGSLIEEHGQIIGSSLIGQSFTKPGYFHGRPSAAGTNGYDAANSGGSNLAPGARALASRIGTDIAALHQKPGILIPADLVTTSASGLDPDISPEAALFQIPRVAQARNLSEATLRQMVTAATQTPVLGIIGEPHVNVLQLNRQLDANGPKRLFGNSPERRISGGSGPLPRPNHPTGYHSMGGWAGEADRNRNFQTVSKAQK